ncbi:hypothetical protein [Cellulomonas sp. HZM]|uniref:hypothetical protein n=1 Tax=Cellulomonas sp. HZM TaxID=1454010 RepID=UPI0012DC3238|nr:hypothetical protein [Cellulomonas sp. HZM]
MSVPLVRNVVVDGTTFALTILPGGGEGATQIGSPLAGRGFAISHSDGTLLTQDEWLERIRAWLTQVDDG